MASPYDPIPFDEVPDEAESALIYAWLAEHDAPCPACGYNLRGVVSRLCPECGTPIELHIGSTNLPLGAWLSAIIMLVSTTSLSAGFAVHETIWLLSGGNNKFIYLFYIAFGFVFMGPISIAYLLMNRNKFYRLGEGAQSAILVVALGALFFSILFLITIC